MYLTTYQFVKLMCFFVKICKISEFRIPCWLRTLRSTSSSKTTTGNTFLGFRKLANESWPTFPEGTPLVCRLEGRLVLTTRKRPMYLVTSQSELFFARTEVCKVSRRRLHSAPSPTTTRCLLLFYRQTLSPVLFCLVPVLRSVPNSSRPGFR